MASSSGNSSVPNLHDWTEEEVIQHLGRKSPDIFNSMIEETATIEATTLGRRPPSSAGDLERLPSEMLVLILQHLDLQSLHKFMGASFRTKEIVESMLIYQDLMKYVPSTLVVLGYVNLAGCHSILDLHTALSSEKCLSCERFGAYIFLPTCERACLTCLHRNMRFWVLPVSDAQDLYGIPEEEMHRMRGTMSVYVGRAVERWRKLVSVRLARELGIAIHGSREAMEAWVLKSRKLGGRLNTYKWWVKAGEELLDWDGEGVLDAPRSICWGRASMRFPHLRPSRAVDPGFWCEGCRFRRQQISAMYNYSHGMYYTGLVAPPGVREEGSGGDKELAMRHREEIREWSRSGLLDHVLTCTGAQELVKQQSTTG